MIPYDFFMQGKTWNMGYGDRLALITTACKNTSTKDSAIILVETHIVNSYEEAIELCTHYIKIGSEGIILKERSAPWEDRRSKYCLKMKALISGDFRCVGIQHGNYGTKYEDGIGALICESDDGEIQFKVGTGLTDADRFRPYSDYIGKVLEVEYNEVIKSKGSKKKSLFLPVFKQIRLDKDTTNV
jgi:ATP-dependent DNA ligase